MTVLPSLPSFYEEFQSDNSSVAKPRFARWETGKAAFPYYELKEAFEIRPGCLWNYGRDTPYPVHGYWGSCPICYHERRQFGPPDDHWFPDFRVCGPRGQKFRIFPHSSDGIFELAYPPCSHAKEIAELFRRWEITSEHLYGPDERLPRQIMPWRPDLSVSSGWGHCRRDVLTRRPRLGPAPGYTWGDVQQVQRLLHFIEETAEEVNGDEGACAQAAELLEEEFGPWLDYVASRFAGAPAEVEEVKHQGRRPQQESESALPSRLPAPLPLIRWYATRELTPTPHLLDAWEALRTERAAAEAAKGKGFCLLNFSDPEPEGDDFLVQGVLTRDESFVGGAPSKSLKTLALGLDLGISMATATPFLGQFPVPKPVRVLLVSGESGRRTLKRAAARIAKAKGLDGVPPEFSLCTQLPHLDNEAELLELRRLIEQHRAEVLILDPLYLCLSSPDSRFNSADLNDVGPRLRRVEALCRSLGCTLGILAHARKAIPLGQPLRLEDLAGAGIAAFFRQWVLFNKREAFDPQAGHHRLVATYGGSAGHSGAADIDVVEGPLQGDDFRHEWQVTVADLTSDADAATGAATPAASTSSTQPPAGKKNKEQRWVAKLRDALTSLSVQVGATIQHTPLARAARLDAKQMKGGLAVLIADGTLRQVSAEGESPRLYMRLK